MQLHEGVWRFLDELNKKRGITEVIINNVDNVYIDLDGELTRLNTNFSVNEIKQFCSDVAKYNATNFNSEFPILDGNLPDGSRINIISSEYTQSAPAITIRKYTKSINTFDNNPGVFGIDDKVKDFLKTIVAAKSNIIVSGGTGSGKTTLLNLLLQEVSKFERIVTIEDTKELSFEIPNTVRLVANKGKKQVLTMKDLLKNTLRMRPDRIIIGEVRGSESFDLLQAMNTGHDGSMCTIHSNSTKECFSRIENLFLLAGYDVPIYAIRQQIANALDFVIQIERTRDSKRIISKISEVTGMEGENILRQDIASLIDGKLSLTGIVPIRMKKLMGIGLSSDFFN